MAAILENNKAGRKLFFAGYTYNKKKTSADAVYWVCSERVKYDCKGSAKTLIDLTQPRVSKLHISHCNFEQQFMILQDLNSRAALMIQYNAEISSGHV